MDEKGIRAYWKTLQHELREYEYARARGQEEDAHMVLGLARRVMDCVDALPAPSRTMLARREITEAIIIAYRPSFPSRTAQEPRAYELLGFSALNRA